MRQEVYTIIAGALFASLAIAQSPRYTVADLGTLGGASSSASSNNNSGVVSGYATLQDGTSHAILWSKGKLTDIAAQASAGLGGPDSNSSAFSSNGRGVAIGEAETADKDAENFCGFGTGLRCVPFVWQNGAGMKALPLLGGNNGGAISINSSGDIVGVSENATLDPNCIGTQKLRYDPVLWAAGRGDVRKLALLTVDTVGVALWNNDNGQAVGQSGSCGNTTLPPLVVGPHAVLWEKDGSVHDLGNLGGACLVPCKNAAGPFGNVALAINNQGQVVGSSALRGETTNHAFLWTKGAGMQDLGTLYPGDVSSVALGLNEKGAIVGGSFDKNGNPSAFLWQNGTMTDLNPLMSSDSPFVQLLIGFSVNASGEIAGIGVTRKGEVHGFVAAPHTSSSAAPKNATATTRQVTLDGTGSASADGSALTYSWSIPYGSPQAAIMQGNTATPTVQFSSGRGLYSFQLTVTDQAGVSATDIATVNYQGN